MTKKDFIAGFKSAHSDGTTKINAIKFLLYESGARELGLKGVKDLYDASLLKEGDVNENMYAVFKPYVLAHQRGFVKITEDKCLYDCRRCAGGGFMAANSSEITKPQCAEIECSGKLLAHVNIVTTIRRIKKEEA